MHSQKNLYNVNNVDFVILYYSVGTVDWSDLEKESDPGKLLDILYGKVYTIFD